MRALIRPRMRTHFTQTCAGRDEAKGGLPVSVIGSFRLSTRPLRSTRSHLYAIALHTHAKFESKRKRIIIEVQYHLPFPPQSDPLPFRA